MDAVMIWGVGQVTCLIFQPILEDLAKDVAKDAAKSYVGKCFQNVFSTIHRKTLTKATGLALNHLLELIENELLDADLDEKQLRELIPAVKKFIELNEVRQTIASLFLDPGYQLLPNTFAVAWQQNNPEFSLQNNFCWQRISKRFSRKITEIRSSSTEIKETFESLSSTQFTNTIKGLAGLPPDFDLETYREALVERFGNLSFDCLDTSGACYNGVRLWNVFVPQSVRECHEYLPQLLEIPKEHQNRFLQQGKPLMAGLVEAEKMQDERRRAYFSQPIRSVLDICSETGQSKAVILGDPGSGKSSLLRFLSLQWARVENATQRYNQSLPLLIELRDYNRWVCPSGKSFIRYLHEASTWHRLNQQTLSHLLKKNDQVLLLLDGLDEVFDPFQREQVINDIHRFSNEYKTTRIIVTSRVVGYLPQRLRDAGFRQYMLQDLDLDQSNEFLKRWHKVTFDDPIEAEIKRLRLSRAISESKPISMLAGNPLLLTMMAILNRHQELPRDRADLYNQASRVLLHQWDTERALGDYPELHGEVDLRAKNAILRKVAYTMQTGPRGLTGNIIDGETLTRLIENYLHDELHFQQARAAASAVVKQLRERNFILCFLGADSYAFVHRTFLEYFCACDFVHRFHVERSMTDNDLVNLFEMHCNEDDWSEVLRLICGQIDEQFVGRIVEVLATHTSLEGWNGEPIPEIPLAIHCLNETRNLSKLEKAGNTLANKVIQIHCIAGHERFVKNLLAAIKEIGDNWPGIPDLEIASKLVSTRVKNRYFIAENWPKFIAHVSNNRSLTMNLVLHQKSTLRMGALNALAEKWPDESTRALLTERAVQDSDSEPRSAALQALAEKWPDETSRALLTERAVQDPDSVLRSTALQALAENWPDETSRALLTDRANHDPSSGTRSTALKSLAQKWQDETSRALLTDRANHDPSSDPRSTALKSLAQKFPDETSRILLTERAVQCPDISSRSAAIEALAENWPDETSRALLVERAVQDPNSSPRRAALHALGENWPDETSRALLIERAVQDSAGSPRSTALKILAEKWPDEASRSLLAERAVQDPDSSPRSVALEALEKWPDKVSRALLTERAVQDPAGSPRSASLKILAEKWPDETSRALLAERAIQDPHSSPRSVALEALGEKWPDEASRTLLTERAIQDPVSGPRQAALRTLADKWPDETTRTVLVERAIQDPDIGTRHTLLQTLVEQWQDETTRTLLSKYAVLNPDSETRHAALEALAEIWPDETSRVLIAARAVQDPAGSPRSAALLALAEKWPDETSRALLTKRAVQDPFGNARSAAIRALAKRWPDETSRALLTKRAVLDPVSSPRSAALLALAENWPDETSRSLLTKRAVLDPAGNPRRAALQALAEKWSDESSRALLADCVVRDPSSGLRSHVLELLAKKWPDETTRVLLTDRANHDLSSGPRSTALKSLAEKWPDETTRALLSVRAVQDPAGSPRIAALQALTEKWPDKTSQAESGAVGTSEQVT